MGVVRLYCRRTRHLVVATVLAGAAVVASATMADASVPLSPTDLTAITSAVDNAIASAKAGLPAGTITAEIESAVASELCSKTQSLIAQYGSADPKEVAEAVISAATDAKVSQFAIGKAMACAALSEQGAIGKDIATAMGSVGTEAELREFDRVVEIGNTAYGDLLASIADSSVEIGAGPVGAPLGGGGVVVGGAAGGGGGGGCANPSCT